MASYSATLTSGLVDVFRARCRRDPELTPDLIVKSTEASAVRHASNLAVICSWRAGVLWPMLEERRGRDSIGEFLVVIGWRRIDTPGYRKVVEGIRLLDQSSVRSWWDALGSVVSANGLDRGLAVYLATRAWLIAHHVDEFMQTAACPAPVARGYMGARGTGR